MLQTVIIDKINRSSDDLAGKLKHHFPSITLRAISEKEDDFFDLARDKSIQLYFINPSLISSETTLKLQSHIVNKALVCISSSYEFLHSEAYWQSVGYLLKPFDDKKLILAVEAAQDKLFHLTSSITDSSLLQNLLLQKTEKQMIGIPTIEGFDIIAVKDIIRCEGLQKCTRILTTEKVDIVSSYNIGMFKNMLSRYSGFISPHRSHIINMNYVKKYKKSGVIIMTRDAHIPVSRNNRDNFLSCFHHF